MLRPEPVKTAIIACLGDLSLRINDCRLDEKINNGAETV